MEGVNKKDLKRQNRLLVLKLLCTTPDISRTILTQKTNLVKMTVSNIINEMISVGAVREHEKIAPEKNAASGRRQTSLSFTAHVPLIMGLFLSRSACHGIVVDLQFHELTSDGFVLESQETDDSLSAKLIALVSRLNAGVGFRVGAIGIATVGPLDAENGIILNPPNFYGIHDYPISEIISSAVNLPCVLQNDMNASALVEKFFGSHKTCRDFIYVGLTNGIGSGIILNDQLYSGSSGFSGEIGHFVIDCNGRSCRCGRCGCLETYASIPVILQQFQDAFHRPFASVAELCAFCEVHSEADVMFRSVCELLAIGLANYCNCLDPELIILGHEGADISDTYIQEIEQQINRRIFARQVKQIRVVRSSFGCNAALYGSAVSVLSEVFAGRLFYERLFGAED